MIDAVKFLDSVIGSDEKINTELNDVFRNLKYKLENEKFREFMQLYKDYSCSKTKENSMRFYDFVSIEEIDGRKIIDYLMKLRCEEFNGTLPVLHDLCSGSKNILDIGCGIGLQSIYLALNMPDDSHITGTDISEKSLDYAIKCADKQGLKNVNFAYCDMMSLNQKKQNEYDCIFIYHALDESSIYGMGSFNFRCCMEDEKIHGARHVLAENGKLILILDFENRDKHYKNYLKLRMQENGFNNVNLINVEKVNEVFIVGEKCKQI